MDLIVVKEIRDLDSRKTIPTSKASTTPTRVQGLEGEEVCRIRGQGLGSREISRIHRERVGMGRRRRADNKHGFRNICTEGVGETPSILAKGTESRLSQRTNPMAQRIPHRVLIVQK